MTAGCFFTISHAATRLSIPTTMRANGFRCRGHGIKSLPSRCAASPKKIKDGNNRGGRQQQCLSSSNQVVIRKHEKAKKHNNQPPKWRRQARLVAGKGANVSRLTVVGSARDEAMEVEQRARKRGGGVTSVIAMSSEGIIDDGNDHCSCCHTPFNG
jgi:hypothetical protein